MIPKSKFLWGVATSAHQIEGNNHNSDWWRWEQEGNIEGGQVSGKACDHISRYQEDLKLASELGVNSYRFSIEWAKIEPQPHHFSEEALQFYDRLLDGCDQYDLDPMVTLNHFTVPQWFAERGGWANPRAAEDYRPFVQKVIDRFGERVNLWITINEPNILTVGSYLAKFLPPAEFSVHKASSSTHQLLKAHVHSYDAIKAANPHARVSIAHNMIDIQPDRKHQLLDQWAAYFVSRFFNWAWLDAIHGKTQNFNIPGVLPKFAPVPEAQGRKTIDFIGINFYTKAYIQWNSKSNLPWKLTFARPNELQSDVQWAVAPKSFEKLLRKVHRRYSSPIIVTENGIADEKDHLRPQYLKEHLKVIQRLLQDKLPIEGYYHWSLMDNFEWSKGFGPRFGLYALDYKTYERTLRASGQIFRELIHDQNVQ